MKAKVIASPLPDRWQLRRRMVMPTLWWITFWSLVMGAAVCWCEDPEPSRVSVKKQPNNHRA